MDQQELETLRKNVSNQNSYITKLEKERNELKEELEKLKAQKPYQPALDEHATRYLRKKMREETIDNAKKSLVEQVSEGVYKTLEPEFMEFLDKHMPIEKTTEGFIIDAFSLVLGRAIANKEHPVHKVLNPASEQQEVKPTSSQATLQQVANLMKEMPPTISNVDASAVAGPTNPVGYEAPKDTSEAMKRFKDKFRNIGGLLIK